MVLASLSRVVPGRLAVPLSEGLSRYQQMQLSHPGIVFLVDPANLDNGPNDIGSQTNCNDGNHTQDYQKHQRRFAEIGCYSLYSLEKPRHALPASRASVAGGVGDEGPPSGEGYSAAIAPAKDRS